MNTLDFYGADWCPDCQRAKAYLKEHNIDFNFIDVEIDKEATARVDEITKGKRIIPNLILNGKSHTNPDNAELANILGVNPQGVIKLYGADWCPDCQRAKSYLQDNGINFQFIEVDKHDWATKLVEETNKGKRIIPTIFIADKSYTNPDNSVLKKILNIGQKKEKHVYDCIIVGAGAAGLTASIYIQRDRFTFLILEKKNIGGNAFLTEKIENYPGFTNISGPKLMERMSNRPKPTELRLKPGWR